MERQLVVRGLLAGMAGGLVAFVFARIFAEPLIQAGIEYESGRDAAQAALDKTVPLEGVEIFNRAVQANLGIGVGIVLYGAAMGLLLAFVYTFCLGRVGRVRPRTLSMLVALGAFVCLYLVPFMKYPANPPAIGHGDTIFERGNLYLIMVGCSVLFGVLAVILGQRLQARFGTWNATLLAAGAYIVAVGVVMALLPQLGELSANVAVYGHHATETPLPLTDAHGTIVYPGFPADVLSGFRRYSVMAQVLLWTTMCLVFAPLADRVLAPGAAPSAAPESAPTLA